jgi:asparagine synthase (glutamine-hydrolysing)
MPWSAGANPLNLTQLEVASGVVLGSVDEQPWPQDPRDPLDVLFEEARQILQRGRCIVAFSGGRDSSAVLATLLHVARHDGFPEPVAVTARWPGDAAADESAWQERVAGELCVQHWEILTPGTDFDLLGPLALGLLQQHGLLWPAPMVALLPLVEAARGGVLVTGDGGDEVFGTWGMARVWSQARRGRRLRSALRPIGGAALPGPLRRRRARTRVRAYQTWLTAEARAAHEAALAAEEVAVAPLWWPDYLHEVGSERGLSLGAISHNAICASHECTFSTPLLAPAFLAALAKRGGRFGLGDRTSAMRAVFSPLLSDDVLRRVSKATFAGVFWGPASREFAAEWDGAGLDARWVDADTLRAAWLEPTPVYGSALPLHAAWLARHGP